MDWISLASTIASFIGTLSIWEAFKYWLNRKTNKRKEEAEADNSEFTVLHDIVKLVQEQLKVEVERYADQTERLRKMQDENFNLIRENGLLKLQLTKQGMMDYDEGNNHED